MEHYVSEFYIKTHVLPKIMNFKSFTTFDVYFHHHLIFQGLAHFVSLDRPFYLDTIKFFYSNLRISSNGYLLSVVNRKKTKLRPNDWFNIVHMMYEGKKLSFANLLEDFSFNCDIALASMVRPNMQGQCVKIVHYLNINSRLLHYVVVYMLTPHAGNFEKLLKEDIFIICVLETTYSLIIISCKICLNVRTLTHFLIWWCIDHPNYAI